MDYNTLKLSDTNIKAKNRNKKTFKFDVSMYKKEILLKKLGNKLEKKLKVHISKTHLIKTLKHANNIFSHYFSREIPLGEARRQENNKSFSLLTLYFPRRLFRFLVYQEFR